MDDGEKRTWWSASRNQERRPEQDVGGQVEGPVGLFPDAPIEFVGLANAGGGQVESRWLGNDLDVLVVDDAE